MEESRPNSPFEMIDATMADQPANDIKNQAVTDVHKVNMVEARKMDPVMVQAHPHLPFLMAAEHHRLIQDEVRNVNALMHGLVEKLADKHDVTAEEISAIKEAVEALKPVVDTFGAEQKAAWDEHTRQLKRIESKQTASTLQGEAGIDKLADIKSQLARANKFAKKLESSVGQLNASYLDTSAAHKGALDTVASQVSEIGNAVQQGSVDTAEIADKITGLIKNAPVDVMAAIAQHDQHLNEIAAPLQGELADMKAQVQLALQSNLTGDQMKDFLSKEIKQLFDSTAAQSIIANAVSRGVGSMVASTITSAIFGAITEPFTIGSAAAAGLNDLMGAIHGFQQTVESVVNTVKAVREEIEATADSISDIKQQVQRLASEDAERDNTLAHHLQQQISGARDLQLSVMENVADRLDSAQGERLRDAVASAPRQIHVAADTAPTAPGMLNALQTAAYMGSNVASGSLAPSMAAMKKKKKIAATAGGNTSYSGHPTNAAGEVLKFGSNSVYMVGTEANCIGDNADHLTPKGGTPDFWRTAYIKRADWQANVVVDASHCYDVRSRMSTCAAAGTPRPAVAITAKSLQAVIELVNATGTPIDATVSWAQPTRLGAIDSSFLSGYLITGRVNDKTFTNAMTSAIRTNTPNLVRDVAYYLTERLEYYDNSGMYAKLLAQIMVQIHGDHHNIAYTTQAWADLDITWINLAAADTAPTAFITPIEKGRICFIEDQDFTHGDAAKMQLMLTIATGNRRIHANLADTHLLAGRYAVFQPIPIAIYARRAQPANWPAAVNTDTFALTAALRELAKARGEEDQMLKGLYIAMDLMGIRYSTGGAAGTDLRYVTHLFGSPELKLPQPMDYNFMARILGFRPALKMAEWEPEFTSFVTTPSDKKLEALAIYLKCENVAASTIMATYNIPKKAITQFMTNAGDVPPVLLLDLLNSLNELELATSVNDFDNDSRMREACKALGGYLGDFNNMCTIYKSTFWLGKARSFPAATVTQMLRDTEVGDALTLRRGSALCLLDIAKKLAYEWAVSLKGGMFDISSEIQMFGPEAEQGWWPVRGDPKYDALVCGDSPYSVILYAWQVLQIMNNRNFNAAAPAGVQFIKKGWQPNGKNVSWPPPVADATLLPAYNAVACCYEPNTMGSYDWYNDLVYVPFLPMAQPWWEKWRDECAQKPYGGFILPDKDARSRGAAVPTPMNLNKGLLARFSRARVTAPETMSEPVLNASAANLN